jgi:ABC-type molybdenum transport system ATPase subunit/photorepair protein PhrA
MRVGKDRRDDLDAIETFLTMRHVDVARGENVVLHDVSLEIGLASTWRFWGRMAAASRR